MRKALIGIAVAAALASSLGTARSENETGDLAKMTNDGYVVVVAQENNTFTGGILGPDGQWATLATTTELIPRPLLHVSVLSDESVDLETADHYATNAGGHGGADLVLPSATLVAPDRFAFTLPTGYNGENVWVSIWAGVVGYPAACSGGIDDSTCDGGALGFYNPAKLVLYRDALDAVPYTTTLA